MQKTHPLQALLHMQGLLTVHASCTNCRMMWRGPLHISSFTLLSSRIVVVREAAVAATSGTLTPLDRFTMSFPDLLAQCLAEVFVDCRNFGTVRNAQREPQTLDKGRLLRTDHRTSAR